MDNPLPIATIVIAAVSLLMTLYTLLTKAGADKIAELRQEIADCRRQCDESNTKLMKKEQENAQLQANNATLQFEKLTLLERLVNRGPA